MISLKLNKKSLVIVSVAASLLGAGVLLGYANYPRIADSWDPGGAKTALEISLGESPGEHGPGGERGVRGESGGRAARRPAAPSWPPTTSSTRSAAAPASSSTTTLAPMPSWVQWRTPLPTSSARSGSRSTSPTERNSVPPLRWTWLPTRCWRSTCPPPRHPSPVGLPTPRWAATLKEAKSTPRASVRMALSPWPAANTAPAPSGSTTPAASGAVADRADQNSPGGDGVTSCGV